MHSDIAADVQFAKCIDNSIVKVAQRAMERAWGFSKGSTKTPPSVGLSICHRAISPELYQAVEIFTFDVFNVQKTQNVGIFQGMPYINLLTNFLLGLYICLTIQSLREIKV